MVWVSPFGLAIIVLFNVIAALFFVRLLFIRNVAGGSLVLRSFEVRPQPASVQSDVIRVEGRRGGLISYLLTLIGLDSTCTFRATPQYVEWVDSSLFGKTHAMVPLQHVACVWGGVTRPLLLLFFAGYFFLNAFLSLITFGVHLESFVLCLLLVVAAGVSIVFYFLKQRFFVVIRSEAGPEIAFSMTPSVLEGQTVDFPKALAAVQLLKNLTLGALQGAPMTVVATPQQTPAYPVPDQSQSSISPKVAPPPLTPQAESPLFTGPEPPPRQEPEPEDVFSLSDPEEVAMKALRRAVKLYNDGQHEEGVRLLQEIVRLNPGTKAARIAEGHLAKLGRRA